MDKENEKKEGFSFWKLVPYVLIAVIVFSVGSCFSGDDGKVKRDTWYSFNDMPQLYIQNGVIDVAVERGMEVHFAYYPYCFKCDDLCEPFQTSYVSLSEKTKTSVHECDCGNTINVRFKLEF